MVVMERRMEFAFEVAVREHDSFVQLIHLNEAQFIWLFFWKTDSLLRLLCSDRGSERSLQSVVFARRSHFLTSFSVLNC